MYIDDEIWIVILSDGLKLSYFRIQAITLLVDIKNEFDIFLLQTKLLFKK